MVGAAEALSEVVLDDEYFVGQGPPLRLRADITSRSTAPTKVIGARPTLRSSDCTSHMNARGEYRAPRRIPEVLRIGVRDVGHIPRLNRSGGLPSVLVLAPFLARGGAEHTLFETLFELRRRFHFVIATLAPHREELGDRRRDFLAITPDIFPLGDLVHPDVMGGLIETLVASRGIQTLYNANGSTVFYDLLPRIRRRFPDLFVLDHLYDHEVGYIDRYDMKSAPLVDLCVAENHVIARSLVENRSWPAERTRVIWPCGRRAGEIPDRAGAALARRELRDRLGVAPDDVLFLTAARLHSQKRPFDLIRLAERVAGRGRAHFVWLGGGPLESEFVESARRAVERGARLHVLPFQSDVPRWIAAADVGCLVSEYEGLPVFFMECCQQGRPFLATDVGDLGGLLKSSMAGRVAPVGDLDALEVGVHELSSAQIRAEAASRAIALAPRFDVATCAEQYADALLSRPSPT
jgi:glycosyltransferase involved in cell wall biosynthesis